MAMLIVQLRVKDYRKWRRLYDAQAHLRKKATMGSAQVYRDADKPHKLAIVFKVRDIDKAKAYLDSAHLREVMKAAGVIGKPIRTFAGATLQSLPQPVKGKASGRKELREKPPEASTDAWVRFQQAFQAWQDEAAKLLRPIKP
jgi:quinol monooxygenase YgiN